MKKLDMKILEEAKVRAIDGLSEVSTMGKPAVKAAVHEPFSVMNAFAAGQIDFEQLLAGIPSVNTVLRDKQKEFPCLKLSPIETLDAAFQQELKAFAQRLASATEQARRDRLMAFYFLFWLSLYSLNVDREPELGWWQEQLGSACCTVHLNGVSACIRLLAGQWVEEREGFLARLRPSFQQALARLKEKSPLTCHCLEGLSR